MDCACAKPDDGKVLGSRLLLWFLEVDPFVFQVFYQELVANPHLRSAAPGLSVAGWVGFEPQTQTLCARIK